MYINFIKRIIDVILSLIGIVILSVPILIIVIIIKREDPGPAFFTQKRIGIHKKYFSLVKFRSMRLDTPHDVPTHQLENPEQYILKIGKWMRKYSVDELPQLINIIKASCII